MQTRINKEKNSKIEIEVTIPWKDFNKYWDKGFKKIQEMAEVDGFRKGMAPEDMIVSKYGEMTILEAMADEAINETYPVVVMENKIKIISHPHIHVVRLAKGEDFTYHAHVDVAPEINLPDYKKIAKDILKDKVEVKVTDEDIEKITTDLRKMRATKKEIVNEDTKEVASEEVLPDLNDEFAQSFGEEFKNLNILKDKIRENALLEKQQIEKEKIRTNLLEKMVSEVKAELPDSLVAGEVERMLAQTKADVEKFGGKFEDYLVHIKKTEEDLKNDLRDPATKRAMSQLIIFEIANKEKIKPTDEEIDVECVKILAQVQGADESRVRAYAEQILINEKVLQFLGV